MESPPSAHVRGDGRFLHTPDTPNERNPNAILLREQDAERQKLALDNFNQALRINYLEEKLLSFKRGTAFEEEDLENEVIQLRIALQERDVELKQKSATLIRAKEALEARDRLLLEAREQIEQLQRQQQQQQQPIYDGTVVEQLKQELAGALAQEQRWQQRVQELEDELRKYEDQVTRLTSTHQDELREIRSNAEREIERQRQKRTQLEAAQMKAAMEIEHWQSLNKQHEEQFATAKMQLEEKLTKQKEYLETRYQTKMKAMEEQVAAQLTQLQRESEKYRSEQTQLLTDREKAHFERERIAMEADHVKQEKARVQAEMERMAKELERVTAELEKLRVEKLKLVTTCELNAQSLENYKADRESAMDNIHALETELHEWRKRCREHEVTIKTLETRTQQAEGEVKRVSEQLELVTVRTQQTSNERLLALEKDRHTIEQDNYRLRTELSTFQHELESLERKFKSCEERLSDEIQRTQEYHDRLLDCERELAEKSTHIDELEQHLANMTQSSSMTETARLQQQSEIANRFAAEKNHFTKVLQDERARVDEMQKSMSLLEKKNGSLVQELDAIEREFCTMVGYNTHSVNGERRRSVLSLARDAVKTLQMDFKADVTSLQNQWQQQTALMGNHIDQLANQLHASQIKLEMLQQTAFHSKDEKQSLDKNWSMRYEQFRLEKERERSSMEEELRRYQSKIATAEQDLAQTKHELEKVTSTQNSSRAELERDYHDLKQSNRMLHEEVQERKRSAEHARKQYMLAVKENKSLLGAIDVYKNAIADREKDIEYYKAQLMKYTQQLQRRVSMGEVKQTLLEQLEQTQYMINATYKRWSENGIGNSDLVSDHVVTDESAAVVVQLDEYIGRMEVVTERWGEFVIKSQDFHRRYGDAWQSATWSHNPKDRPLWVDELERKCSRLLAESLRVSEAFRDVVESILGAIQRDREEKRRLEKERALEVKDNQPVRDSKSWIPLDNDFFDGLQSPNNQQSPYKKRGSIATSRPSSTKLRTNGIYGSSLSSLGRIGSELQEIEKKIKKYND